jgi:hypothetical protein
MSTGLQKTRDELGVEDTNNFVFKRFSDKLKISQGPLKKTESDVSTKAIWGRGTVYEEWGNANTVWSDGIPVSTSLISVESPNDRFRDTFDLTTFIDTTNTTADITTAGEVSFTAGEVLQSEVVAKDTRTFTKATLTVTITSGSYDLELTADGTNWETVTNNTQHTFTNTGSEIKYRIKTPSEQLITSDGNTFLTSDGDNFLVVGAGSGGTITEVIVTYS